MNFNYYEIRPCVEIKGHETHSFKSSEWCPMRQGYISTPKGSEAEAKAFQAERGGELFWTLYGHDADTGMWSAIGDFPSFDVAYEIMNGILAPMAAARDQLEAHGGASVGHQVSCDLDDIINQSSNDERL